MTRRVVRRRVRAELLSSAGDVGHLPVHLMLTWVSWDPYAVSAVFNKRPAWLFARSLLVDGLHGPVGVGDVSVLPHWANPAHVELIVSSPDGRAGFRLLLVEVEDFLAATHRITPVGAETVPDTAFTTTTTEGEIR